MVGANGRQTDKRVGVIRTASHKKKERERRQKRMEIIKKGHSEWIKKNSLKSHIKKSLCRLPGRDSRNKSIDKPRENPQKNPRMNSRENPRQNPRENPDEPPNPRPSCPPNPREISDLPRTHTANDYIDTRICNVRYTDAQMLYMHTQTHTQRLHLQPHQAIDHLMTYMYRCALLLLFVSSEQRQKGSEFRM